MKDEKILSEEVLSEEQLEEVVGGAVRDLSRDSVFMHALGLTARAFKPNQLDGDNFKIAADMMNGTIMKFGLEIRASSDGENRYESFYRNEDGSGGGAIMTRREFYEKLCAIAGKPDFEYWNYL